MIEKNRRNDRWKYCFSKQNEPVYTMYHNKRENLTIMNQIFLIESCQTNEDKYVNDFLTLKRDLLTFKEMMSSLEPK